MGVETERVALVSIPGELFIDTVTMKNSSPMSGDMVSVFRISYKPNNEDISTITFIKQCKYVEAENMLKNDPPTRQRYKDYGYVKPVRYVRQPSGSFAIIDGMESCAGILNISEDVAKIVTKALNKGMGLT